MKDPCGYSPDHEWYIDARELTNREKIELRKIHAEKISKLVAVILTAISLIISGIIIRFVELRYIESHNCSNKSESMIELLTTVRNMNQIVFKNYDISRSNQNVCRDLRSKVTDLHHERFPNQYRNAFGRENIKNNSGKR